MKRSSLYSKLSIFYPTLQNVHTTSSCISLLFNNSFLSHPTKTTKGTLWIINLETTIFYWLTSWKERKTQENHNSHLHEHSLHHFGVTLAPQPKRINKKGWTSQYQIQNVDIFSIFHWTTITRESLWPINTSSLESH